MKPIPSISDLGSSLLMIKSSILYVFILPSTVNGTDEKSKFTVTSYLATVDAVTENEPVAALALDDKASKAENNVIFKFLIILLLH
jgi:hypothetical protein